MVMMGIVYIYKFWGRFDDRNDLLPSGIPWKGPKILAAYLLLFFAP